LDGTKVKANASKHKAMSYGRMVAAEARLEAEVAALLKRAEAKDAAEDEEYGLGRRGDELPRELARRESRLRAIREARAALEQEAREQAEQQAATARAKLARRQRQQERTGKKPPGRVPRVPDPDTAKPAAKAQRNFTDPESRIMVDGATKSFEQAYNVQGAVDSEAQIIVAAATTQQPNDKQQLVPLLTEVEQNTGQLPAKVSADSGYFSEGALTDKRLAAVDLYVTPDGRRHGKRETPTTGEAPVDASLSERMRHKLRTPAGHETYRMRKAIVEPVFGQIKEAQGFRRFSFRGLQHVTAEWRLVCLTHNLLKLFRASRLQGGVCLQAG
jgi:hypothetical protein